MTTDQPKTPLTEEQWEELTDRLTNALAHDILTCLAQPKPGEGMTTVTVTCQLPESIAKFITDVMDSARKRSDVLREGFQWGLGQLVCIGALARKPGPATLPDWAHKPTTDSVSVKQSHLRLLH